MQKKPWLSYWDLAGKGPLTTVAIVASPKAIEACFIIYDILPNQLVNAYGNTFSRLIFLLTKNWE